MNTSQAWIGRVEFHTPSIIHYPISLAGYTSVDLYVALLSNAVDVSADKSVLALNAQ